MARKKNVYHNNHSNTATYNRHMKSWDSDRISATAKNTPRAFDEVLEKLGPGQHYFFFTSLARYKGPNAAGAQRMLQYGQQAFSLAEQKEDYNEIMNECLRVISGFKKFEATNEYNIFKEKLEPLLKNYPELYDTFKDTFVDNEINYIKFMALLNVFGENLDDAKAKFADMTNHTRDFDNTYQQVFNDTKALARDEKKNDDKDDYLFNFAHRAEMVEKTREQLEQKTSQAEDVLSEALYTVQKIHDGADKRKDIGAIRSLIQTMINSGQMSMEAAEIKSHLGPREDDALLLAMYQKLSSWAKTYKTDITKLIAEMQKDHKEFGTLNLDRHNYKTGANIPKNFRTLVAHLDLLLKQHDIVTQQFDDIENMFSRNNKNKLNVRKGSKFNQYSGLLKKRRLLIINALEQMKLNGSQYWKLKELKNLEIGADSLPPEVRQGKDEFDIRKKEHFQHYMQLIGSILKIPHLQNGQLDTDKIISRLETIIKTSEAASRKEMITITSETGGALDLAKIMEGYIARVGTENQREDSFLIGYGVYRGEEAKVDSVQQLLSGNTDLIQKMQKSLFQARQTDIYKEIKKINKQNKRPELAYGVQTTLKASQKIDLQIAQELADELGLDDLEKVRNALKDLFVIEKSDKFSTTFNSKEFGFAGGSLGGNLEQQLTTLNDMMALGGITTFDLDFLINACMNAGPGMLGYGQKDKIETYLSSLASICMFTSGAQSLKEYADSLLEDVVPALSTTKIHIFQLNGTFVPLSYTLSLMEAGLMKCFNKLKDEFSLDGNAGNKVSIYNPVNEASDKITKLYRNSRGKEFEIGDWEATANAGLSKINLNMAIMGSYLDVMDEVNQVLQGI